MSEYPDLDADFFGPRTILDLLIVNGIDPAHLADERRDVVASHDIDTYRRRGNTARIEADITLDAYRDAARRLIWNTHGEYSRTENIYFNLLVGLVWSDCDDLAHWTLSLVRARDCAIKLGNRLLAGEISVYIDPVFSPGIEAEDAGRHHLAISLYQQQLDEAQLKNGDEVWLNFMIASCLYRIIMTDSETLGPDRSKLISVGEHHLDIALVSPVFTDVIRIISAMQRLQHDFTMLHLPHK